MDFLWNKLTEWLKEMLVGGVMGNLSGLFDSVNEQVAEIAGTVGTTPQGWNGSVFSMVQSLSETVIVPIAGIILAIVMTMELIQMIVDRNNMNDFELSQIYKRVFKTFFAVMIVTNTWNLVMAIFDLAQHVVNNAAGVILSDTSIDLSTLITDMEARLMEMEIGPLFSLWIQSALIGIISWILTIQSRFKRPKKRPYRTENIYAALMKQAQLKREVRKSLTSGVIARNDAAQPAPGHSRVMAEKGG